ncbi:MAG: Tetratricopeptide repeat [Planctomycetota bacterium]
MTAVRSQATLRLAALCLAVLPGCAGTPLPTGSTATSDRYERLDDPQGAEAYESAMRALAKGDRAAALAGLRTTIAKCPEHVRAHRLYQDLAREVGGSEAAAMLAFYKDLSASPAAATTPLPAYLAARLAETSYAQGNALTRLAAAHPDFAWAHFSLARVSRQQGRLQQALDGFGRALQTGSGLHEARQERAEVLVELGRYEEAAVDYEAYLAAVAADRAAVRAYVDLLLYRLRRVDRARALLTPLLADAPRDLELRMQMAAVRWFANQPKEALVDYLGILADQPTLARAALNVGLLYYEVLPKDEAAKRLLWPKAAQAFEWFLSCGEAQDGHEQFERTVGVPYRLAKIRDLCGVLRFDDVRNLAALRWSDF